MPNCEQLIIDIQETIRENGNNEITGPVLQDVLLDIVYALCNEQPAFDALTMWQLLGAATEEQINVSHLSATDVAGMLTQSGYKLTDTTYALATDAVAGLLKTGYAENGKNYAVKLDDTGRAYVNVPWTDKFDTYFGVDEDGNVYVKGNRGFYGNSFISARGSDPEAGSGGSGLDVQAMWYALGQPTGEKINASHIPNLTISKITGLQGELDSKLSGITGEMVTEALGYTPYDASQIGSASVKYAASAGKVAHALSIVAGDVTTVYDGSAAKSVTVPTAVQMALWDKVGGLFDLDADGNVYVKDNRGFYGNSFVSARGSDPEAGSGGSGLDVQAMWYALGQPTGEKINASHIPNLTISKITGLQGELDSKLSGITGEMVTEALGYTPYDASQIGSASVKYAASAGKVAHALSIVAGDVTTVYDGSAAKSVTVPTAVQMALWDKVGGLFDLDADGNVYVKDNRGFYGNSFVSARGGDPGAGSGGGSGVDMESVWYALGQPTTEKINVSHIPALQQLSGSLTNAQLANSAITVAGVSVSLGGAVSTEQIAGALGLGSNAYTSTAYLPLAGGTMTGEILMTNSKAFVARMATDTSNYRTALGWRSVASGALIAQIGYWNTDRSITLNPCSDEVSEVYNDAVGKYNFVVGKNRLTYNTYPLLHSGNYTNYTVTKTGVGASGTWGISISGTAADASKLGGIYSADYMSHFRQSGVNIDTYATRSPKIIEVSESAGTKPLPSLWLQVMQWGSNDPAFGFQMAHQYAAYGNLYFRQKASGVWGGWRTLLDTANYATLIDSRYVKKSGDTMTGTLTFPTATNAYDSLAVRFSGVSTRIGVDAAGGLGLYAQDALYLRPSWTYGGTSYGLIIKSSNITYNGHPIWHAGNDGAGSGLDADLLDGYQATSFQFAVSHNYELSLSGGSRGRYVILLHPDTLSSANNSLPVGYSVQGTFHLFRPLGNGTASIIVKSGAGYSSTWNSGSIIAMPDYHCFPSMKLVTCNYGGKLYRALFVDAIQDIANLYFRGVVMNRDTNFGLAVKYYDYGTSAVTNSEVNGSIADFQRYRAILFPQLIEGTITSAQKLATARSIWGQTFDGTQGVDGHLYLGSPDYRLYFGTSGLTTFLTASGGLFQIVSANDTSWKAALVAVNLSTGNMGLGTTSPSYKLDVIGTIHSTTGIWSNGYVSAKGQDATSDARYKRDVAALPAQAALAVLMRLRPSTWAWKDDGRRGAGFIAQEVQGVLPEAVREVGNGEDRHLALNYQMLHAYEVSVLQTHEERLTKLENEIKRIQHGS